MILHPNYDTYECNFFKVIVGRMGIVNIHIWALSDATKIPNDATIKNERVLLGICFTNKPKFPCHGPQDAR